MDVLLESEGVKTSVPVYPSHPSQATDSGCLCLAYVWPVRTRQFQFGDVRVKLRRLYPKNKSG